MNSKLVALLLMLMFVGMHFGGAGAPTGPTNLTTVMSSLCSTAKSIMLIGMFMMILLAAFTYAVGQIMGAETRARATVWATAMFTGALFAGLIYAITPWALKLITGIDVSSQCS